ncbi:MAG: hypothetical protein H8D23_17570 [Candidatus Brocadiales bacterium]|nr:hypothetical protein [Candidatus Brocadiales bacterium]
MATINDWDFQSKQVDPNMDSHDFVSSQSLVFCTIPPLTGTGGDEDLDGNISDVTKWVPIGLVENASLQQRRQVNELFEIGSKKMFQIPGRTFRRASLARVVFDGDSLLNAASGGVDAEGVNLGEAGDGVAADANSKFYINLASSYFDTPKNIGLVIRDQEEEFYGALALKHCFIESHQMSMAAQQTVVMENISMTVSEFVPIVVTVNNETGALG